MGNFHLGRKALAAIGLVGLCMSTASCTTNTVPETAETSSSKSTITGTADAGSEQPTSVTALPPVATTPGSQSVPPANESKKPGNSNHGEIVISIQGGSLPAESRCEGFASSDDEVNSGGGGLGGATQKLGSIAVSEPTKVSLLPGTYQIGINCLLDSVKWAATSAPTQVVRGKSIELRLHPELSK